MKLFQCSEKHRWGSEKSDHCPVCLKQSEDLVSKKSDEMCPCCGSYNGIWVGVNSMQYCEHCKFEWNVGLTKIDILQIILDFKKK